MCSWPVNKVRNCSLKWAKKILIKLNKLHSKVDGKMTYLKLVFLMAYLRNETKDTCNIGDCMVLKLKFMHVLNFVSDFLFNLMLLW